MVDVVCAVLCNVRIPRHVAVRGVINNPTAAPTFNFILPTWPLGIITFMPFGTRGVVVVIVAMA